jgi:hypothetical protein
MSDRPPLSGPVGLLVHCRLDPVPDLYPPRTRDLTFLTLSRICIRPEREI